MPQPDLSPYPVLLLGMGTVRIAPVGESTADWRVASLVDLVV